MALSIRTALADIERAIARTLRLALVARQTVADVAGLRAQVVLGDGGTVATREGTPVYVTSAGSCFEWSRAATADDDGASVVRPSEVDAGSAGRWLLTSSKVQAGYLQSVNFWQGETRKQEFQARIYADRPSVAIVWESSENAPRSSIPGAIYDYACRFSIWCVDENMRGDYEALLGSDFASDSGHPGVIAILGDVKKTLADENKRSIVPADPASGPLATGGSVKIVQIGAEDMEDANLGERVLVMSLGAICSQEEPAAFPEHAPGGRTRSTRVVPCPKRPRARSGVGGVGSIGAGDHALAAPPPDRTWRQ